MKAETLERIASGLRRRLILGYALFSTLLLAGSGMIFRTLLEDLVNQNVRQNLDQEWAAMKGFVRITEGSPKWFYDRDDPDETYVVSRLQRVYLLTTAQGSVLQSSDIYASLGEDTPDDVRIALLSPNPTWRVRKSAQGGAYLLRSGVIYSNDKHHNPYFVSIGRSLAENQTIIHRFTQIYIGLIAIMLFGGCVLGWFIPARTPTPHP
jgi:hypothetical protein